LFIKFKFGIKFFKSAANIENIFLTNTIIFYVIKHVFQQITDNQVQKKFHFNKNHVQHTQKNG